MFIWWYFKQSRHFLFFLLNNYFIFYESTAIAITLEISAKVARTFKLAAEVFVNSNLLVKIFGATAEGDGKQIGLFDRKHRN